MRSILAAAVLAFAAPATQAWATNDHHAQAEAGTDEAKIAIVMEMAQAWHDLDWDKVADMFAEDGSLHSMMIDPVIGRETIRARIAGLGAGISEITLNYHHVGVIDGLVFVERTDEFVYNGRAGDVPVVGVIEIGEDGLITEWREYYDRAELLEALGMSEDFDNGER